MQLLSLSLAVLLFSDSSPSQTISDCLLRRCCFVVDVAMLLLTSRLTHSSTFDVAISRASWLNGYDATIKWLCDDDGDVEDDLSRYSPLHFIAISRADSNDLPRFLAVSLISFISFVEMSLVIILLLDARVVRRNGLLEMPIFLIR